MNEPTRRQLYNLIETWAARGMTYDNMLAALKRRFGWDAVEAETRIYDAEGFMSGK